MHNCGKFHAHGVKFEGLNRAGQRFDMPPINLHLKAINLGAPLGYVHEFNTATFDV